MTQDQVAVRVVVYGRVQGVFFRAPTRERATELGLVGWVRNRPDGTVEAHLQGPRDQVEAMRAWCEIGSPLSQVARVAEEHVPLGADSDFIIRR